MRGFTVVCAVLNIPLCLGHVLPSTEVLTRGNLKSLMFRRQDTCVNNPTYSSTGPSRGGDYMPWNLMLDPTNAAFSGKTYVTIVNLSPHRFKLAAKHSYQMTDFDWDDIPSGKARQNLANYASVTQGNAVDTNGEAYYDIEGTDKKFVIRATTHIPDEYPRRIVMDLTGMGLGQREYKVPGQEVSVTLVITGSDSYGFISSLQHGPGNWMNQLRDIISGRTLKQIVMPGTHDAGMSKLTDAMVSVGSERNTQTQALNIYDQLRAGSRWMDLRIASIHQVSPKCCDNYDFWAAHVSDEAADVPIGNTGENMSEVIQELNKFTDENYGEVIVLQFRYLIGIKRVPGGAIYWDENIKNSFFDQLKQIKRRCPNIASGDIGNSVMGDLMDQNGGEGCVLIFLDTTHLDNQIPDASKQISPSDGIYRRNDIDWTDAWPDKEDTKQMADWAVNSWTQARTNFHVGQWIITPNFLTSTFAYSLQDIAVLPTNPALYWRGVNEITPQAFPNVLLVDYIGLTVVNEAAWDLLSADMYALAIGLNLYTLSENCDIKTKTGVRHPSLKTLAVNSTGTANVSANNLVSSWNGIIFANGTKIDDPPSDLHPGRVEVLLSGTVFGNGTILDQGKHNPHYHSKSF